jgi:TolB-like protein/Tfp pilus assembly protein PilF
MPFADADGDRGGYADGLAHDVITRLAKLRSLFVIAQGTMYALRERSVRADEAARTLDVDYVVTGSVRRRADRLLVNVQLAETQGARIAWAETYEQTLAGALEVIDDVGDRIVASIAAEIESVERNRALLKAPNSLDAWEALHRGLWHMYRFAREDNDRAREFFERAVRLDPTFARAYAALSFTHWQSAFQGWGDVAAETERAYATAGSSLMADDRDPAAHYAMGRALWLRGAHDASLAELERAVELSPNFALGHYAVGFVQSVAGDPAAAIEAADRSYALSPFDPLLFGMFGARAMALARLQRFDEAAAWALKAAARPNAHVHIRAIAALTLTLADSMDEARRQLAAIRQAAPDYALGDYLRTFRFDDDGRALFAGAATRLGLRP